MSFQKAFRKMYNLRGGALNLNDFAIKIKYEDNSEKWFKQDGTLLANGSGYDDKGKDLMVLNTSELNKLKIKFQIVGKNIKTFNEAKKAEDKFIDMKNYLEKKQ